MNPGGNKPELPAKPERARISSKELIEKQKNWIQHFKSTSKTPGHANHGAAKHAVIQDTINRINEKEDWVKERSGLLSGWMASPTVAPPPPPLASHSSPSFTTTTSSSSSSSSQLEAKESLNFLSARRRFEVKDIAHFSIRFSRNN